MPGLKLEDLDGLLGYDPATHSIAGMPTMGNESHPILAARSGAAPSSPPETPGYTPDAMGASIPQLQQPTKQQSHAAGKQEFKLGMPHVTDQPETPGYYQQKESVNQYEQAHPWGSDVSAHPGMGGKIGHVLGKIGNIAGDAVAPGLMLGIPGSDMNRRFQTAQNASGFENAEAGQQKEAQTGLEKAQTAEAEEATQLKAPLTESEINEHNAQAANLLHPQAKTDFEAWQQQNPGKPIEDWLKAQQAAKPPSAEQDTSRATQLRADQAAGKQLSPTDSAWLTGHTKEKTIVPATTAVINQPNKNDARSDKSFQYNQSALDKVRTPIDALAQRFSRLTDTLSQKSPQADALVGPELLTVMAGGQGSGVRMNEAEIARIVGGRSAWENLKASIQHWNTNPDDARSITPDQDMQIRNLIQAVGQKVTAKQQALEQAQERLLDSDDPQEHRRIVADARKALDDIDSGNTWQSEGASSAAGPKPGDVEGGFRFKGGNPADQNSWEKVK